MKILHISNKPLYPTLDGGSVAMASMLRCLEELAPTDHLYLTTQKHPGIANAYPAAISIPVLPEKLFIDTRVRPVRALQALISGRSYNISRFCNNRIATELKTLVSNNQYGLIVLESLFLATYIPVLRSAGAERIVVRTHNVEHELWLQQAKNAKGWKKWYLKQLARTLKREEMLLLNLADETWSITQEDAVRFRELGLKRPVTVVNVAVDTPGTAADYSSNDFFHLGSLNWQPNRDAVERLGNIWPELRRSLKNELHLAGSFTGQPEMAEGEGIVYHGYVENLAGFMQTHGTLCSPLISGSGIRIKLLEAMALGVPCITTTLGAAGIQSPETVMGIADSDEALIHCMTVFSQQERHRREMGLRGRQYVEKYHSFTAVKAQLQRLIGT